MRARVLFSTTGAAVLLLLPSAVPAAPDDRVAAEPAYQSFTPTMRLGTQQPVERDSYTVTKLWSGPLATPLRVTSWFGARPVLATTAGATSSFHSGIDLKAHHGDPVLSIGSGAVEYVGWSGTLGLVVKLRLDDGTTITYAHLSRTDVHTGQRIAPAARLGAVGATGAATGPHLHLEVVEPGRGLVDPAVWLAERGLL